MKSKKIKTFVIDDNPGFTMALQIHLERKGHQVVVHGKATDFPLDENGRCPCSQGEACGDFLIIDHQMQEMTGLEFLRLLAKSQCKGIFQNTILMSGWLTEKEEIEARSLGCEVFHKPFEFKEIFDWIENRVQEIPSPVQPGIS